MHYIKVEKDGTINLPKEARKLFPALSELAIWWEGGSLVLKRVVPTEATEFAERAPKKTPSLTSIAKEIHRIRKGK